MSSKKKRTSTTQPSKPKGARIAKEIVHEESLSGHLTRLIVIAVILIGVKILVEHSRFVQEMERAAMNILQLRLSDVIDGKDLPVTVIDISRVPQSTIAANTLPRTSRDDLIAIVDAVSKEFPAAIGVDINFAPDEQGRMAPDDTRFLEYCLELRDPRSKPIPVFVGVFESISWGPERALGETRFKKLAAGVAVPASGENGATVKLNYEIHLDEEREGIASLSARLAASTHGQSIEKRKLGGLLSEYLPSLFVNVDSVQKQSFKFDQYLVDYGSLKALRKSTVGVVLRDSVITTTDNGKPLSDKHEKIIGNVVLIGRAEETTDQFNVPGESYPVPGVFIQAAGTLTLMQSPLYSVTFLGRMVLDVAVLLVMVATFLFCMLSFSRWKEAETTGFLLSLIVACIAILAFAYWGIQFTGVLWTDFLMVIAALLLHVPLDLVSKAAKAVWDSRKLA